MRIFRPSRRSRGFLLTAAAITVIAGAARLPAQPGAPCPWNTSSIIAGSGDYSIGNHHNLVFAPSKHAGEHTTWSLVRELSPPRLLLRASKDGGCSDFLNTSWFLQTPNQTHGVMVMGNDCKTLHILFAGLNANGYSSVYYHAWDTTTFSWIGPVQTIAEGLSSNWQYGAADITITAKGRVAIAYNCAEPNDPDQPWFEAWWSTVLRVAQPPAEGTQAVFGPGHSVNALPLEAFGTSLHAVGECVHVAFHSAQNSGISEIYYRGFDANGTGSWKQPNSNVSLPQAQHASVVSCITTDDDCSQCDYRIYVLFASRVSGSGRIWLASSPATTIGFSTCLVDDDAPILGGSNHSHYTLANGPNREVYAVFSKRAESYRNLYARRYIDGGCGAPPACEIVTQSVANKFLAVAGVRSSLVMSHPYVSVSDWEDVTLYRAGNTARTVSFGRYTGSRPAVPHLTATNTPTDGQTLCLTVCDVPPNMPGVLYLGLHCTPEFHPGPPFEPGTYIKQDLIAAIPYTTTLCGSGGRWQACLPIAGVLKGQSVYLQAVQLYDFSPTLVPSNSMAVIFDL